MRRILVTIVSHDRPGIIHQASRALADLGCAVFEVSQTTLMGEFAGLFSCGLPATKDLAGFADDLGLALGGSGLAHWVAEAQTGPAGQPAGEAEPYVLTLRGLDQGSIIPEFSGSLAGFEVNIDNLRTVYLGADEAGGGRRVLMFFELSVPRSVHQGGFRQALSLMAEELGLEMSLQHRNIFEAIHRL